MASKISKWAVKAANENILELAQTRRADGKTVAAALPMMGTVNRNELTSIKALTSYVAHNKRVSERVVCNCLLAQFQVPDVTQLQRHDYERVIKFLVDLQADLMLH